MAYVTATSILRKQNVKQVKEIAKNIYGNEYIEEAEKEFVEKYNL